MRVPSHFSPTPLLNIILSRGWMVTLRSSTLSMTNSASVDLWFQFDMAAFCCRLIILKGRATRYSNKQDLKSLHCFTCLSALADKKGPSKIHQNPRFTFEHRHFGGRPRYPIEGHTPAFIALDSSSRSPGIYGCHSGVLATKLLAAEDVETSTLPKLPPPSPPPQNNFQNYFQGVDSVFGCYTKQPSLG